MDIKTIYDPINYWATKIAMQHAVDYLSGVIQGSRKKRAYLKYLMVSILTLSGLLLPTLLHDIGICSDFETILERN